ncbi:MAG: hypothetical protein M3Z46_09900 [Actinomycetota bacterium]|nr:hypothetical protein [Actinomycetota bacterium]
MATLEVRLLGRPTVLLAGEATRPPRGAKPWGLLAYLAGSRRAHPRSEIAELLFSEADDPLGALRWNLAALRRLLDRPDDLKGDSIVLELPDATIDTWLLEEGDPAGLDQPGIGQELLAGIGFPDSPVFDSWLAAERRRVARRSSSLLTEATLFRLARGEFELAIEWATRLLSIDSLDEGHHALLIRTHTLAGDIAAANQQFERCRALLHKELACAPGAAVVAAAHLGTTGRLGPTRPTVPGEAEARLTVAWHSFLGGAVDHAIDLGRAAVTTADGGADTGVQTMSRLFLSAMLGMAVRGWDESSAALAEALHLSEQHGQAFEVATARGISAGNELMRADYQSAIHHATIGAACSDDPGCIALNLTFLSAVESDIGQPAEALAHAYEAVGASEASADPIRIAYASAYAGQALLMQRQPVAARPHVERAVQTAGAMLVLQPWPMALLAEIDVVTGNLDAALAGATRAGALAATTDVAYQQALARRAIALVDAARGDVPSAVEGLTEALRHARLTTGEGYTFHWPVAWILESLANVTAADDPRASRRWATTLHDHATAIGMEEFVRRADRLLATNPLAGLSGPIPERTIQS